MKYQILNTDDQKYKIKISMLDIKFDMVCEILVKEQEKMDMDWKNKEYLKGCKAILKKLLEIQN